MSMGQAWSKPIKIQNSVSSQNFLFSLNTRYFPFVDRQYYVTNLLKTGQAVLEQRHLVPDLLADSRFDHASYAHWSCMEYSKELDVIYPNLTFQALYDCFEETIHELRHQVELIVILTVETTYNLLYRT